MRTNSVIVATGALAKRLGIPNEETFWSSGISACAICDGASHIFRNKVCSTLSVKHVPTCRRVGPPVIMTHPVHIIQGHCLPMRILSHLSDFIRALCAQCTH